MKSVLIVVLALFLSMAPAPPSQAVTIEELQAAEKELEGYLISDGLIEILKLYRECRSRCMFIEKNMEHWECRRLCVERGSEAALRELKR